MEKMLYRIPKRSVAYSNVILIIYVVVVAGLTFMPLQAFPFFNDIIIVRSLGVIASCLAAPYFFRSKIFWAFAFYTLVLYLNYLSEPLVNLGNILAESSAIIISSFLFYYIFIYKDSARLTRTLLWMYIVITIVYTISTFVFYLSNPGVMRSAAMEYNYEAFKPLFMSGLSPYHFPHAIACLIPAYCLGIKNKKAKTGKRIVAFVVLAASLLLIFITQATGALIVAGVALILSIVVNIDAPKKSIRPIIVLSIIFLPLLLSADLQSSILDFIGRLVGPESSYYEKIEEASELVRGTETSSGDIKTRSSLLGQTMNAIITHPFLGVSDGSYGHHNALLDRWADYGLVGFLPLLLGMIWCIKLTLKAIPSNVKSFYLIGVSTNFLMMLTKSMFGWYQWLAFLVILPIAVLYFGYNDNV